MESSSAPGSNEAETSAADRKVLGDLDILIEKMDRVTTLWAPHQGSTAVLPKTHELYDIVGFLEACAPRMVELVEAAAQGGALSDVVLMKALEVNDRLTKLLSDMDGLSFVDEPTDIQPSSSEDAFDAFLSERTGGGMGDLM